MAAAAGYTARQGGQRPVAKPAAAGGGGGSRPCCSTPTWRSTVMPTTRATQPTGRRCPVALRAPPGPPFSLSAACVMLAACWFCEQHTAASGGVREAPSTACHDGGGGSTVNLHSLLPPHPTLHQLRLSKTNMITPKNATSSSFLSFKHVGVGKAGTRQSSRGGRGGGMGCGVQRPCRVHAFRQTGRQTLDGCARARSAGCAERYSFSVGRTVGTVLREHAFVRPGTSLILSLHFFVSLVPAPEATRPARALSPAV